MAGPLTEARVRAEKAESQVEELQAALAESQARVEEYRREVERRDELLAGADADLRESQAREAALVEALGPLAARLESIASRATARNLVIEDWNHIGPEVDAAHAAIASPSAAAQALLERVRSLEKARDTILATREADRDRWLRHVRALVRWASGHAAVFRPEVDAARRDLEQYDGEGR